MKKEHRINQRVSAETKHQLEELCQRWGESQSAVLTRLIDREYQSDKSRLDKLPQSNQ